MQHPEQDLRRTGTILNRKYSRFMIPALLSAVGVSLSEFADSLIVSRLLSADSFAIINLGAPIVLMTAMVYSMTGLGGALLYAEYLAKKEKEKADRYYKCSMLAALVLGLLLLAVFTGFRGSLGPLFGCPAELRADFDGYVQYLCWFIPAGILLMNYTFFLPIVGKPVFSMVLVISANVLNIALDVVLLRFAGMGCEGAAAATLISYTTVLAAGMLAGRLRKVPLSLCRTGLTRKYFREIAAKGFPSGIVQAGYAVTTVFCNNTLNASFGLAGVMAMSLFGQIDSIFAIALSGIIDNNASFAAMLKGEGDYYGIRSLTKSVTVRIVVVCTAMAAGFAVLSGPAASLFNIRDREALDLIAVLTPIYVLHYPFRCLLLVLRDLYNALGRSRYAALLGTLDKVVSIPLVGGLLYLLAGGTGVIAAYPVSTVLILLLVAAVNRSIVKRSKGRYSPVLLLDEQDPLKAVCSFTVRTLEDVSRIGQSIEESMEDYSLNPKTLVRICLAVEEICLYIRENGGEETPVDILVSSAGDRILITCRSPGLPFCPVRAESEDLTPNELLLAKLFRIRHEYVMGLNSTTLSIAEN